MATLSFNRGTDDGTTAGMEFTVFASSVRIPRGSIKVLHVDKNTSIAAKLTGSANVDDAVSSKRVRVFNVISGIVSDIASTQQSFVAPTQRLPLNYYVQPVYFATDRTLLCKCQPTAAFGGDQLTVELRTQADIMVAYIYDRAQEIARVNEQLRDANRELSSNTAFERSKAQTDVWITAYMRAEEQLQSANEQQQSANEQLQRANEQLQRANEKLQSANEQLQSANEQLQSANEQLQSANEQLQSANEQLQRANEQLQAFETRSFTIRRRAT
jgi:hypothetical protein